MYRNWSVTRRMEQLNCTSGLQKFCMTPVKAWRKRAGINRLEELDLPQSTTTVISRIWSQVLGDVVWN